jgi:hypothetical protein
MIRAKDIYTDQERRLMLKMSAMGPVIAQIQLKIRQQSYHHVNAPYIVFEVPTYVFGYPLYTMRDAMEYLTNEFIKAGYWAWTVGEKTLFISWIKPVKTRDVGGTITTTNYRPQVYDNFNYTTG